MCRPAGINLALTLGTIFIVLLTPLSADASEARTFLAHPFYQFDMAPNMSASATLADLDGDEDLDIAVANGRHWAQQNYWFRNNGKGRMLEAVPLGASLKASYQILSAKLNQDSIPDLIVINDQASIDIYLGGTEGYSAYPELKLSGIGNARGAVVTDLDGDGADELIVAQRGASNFVFWGDLAKPFQQRIELGDEKGHSTSVAVADFDGDGRQDVLFSSRGGPLELYLNQGQRQFSKRLLSTPNADVRALAAADLDGDTHPDLVLASIGGENSVLRNTGIGEFEPCAVLGSEDLDSYAVALADFDADGDLDVVVGNDGQANFVHWNQGACSFKEQQIDVEPSEVYAVTTGDLNGDGYPEIVFSNSDQPNAILLNRQLTKD